MLFKLDDKGKLIIDGENKTYSLIGNGVVVTVFFGNEAMRFEPNTDSIVSQVNNFHFINAQKDTLLNAIVGNLRSKIEAHVNLDENGKLIRDDNFNE